MNVTVTELAASEVEADLLLIPLSEEESKERLRALDEEIGGGFQRAAVDFSGKLEETVTLYPENAEAERVVLLGLGPVDEVSAERLRRVMARGAEQAVGFKADVVAAKGPAGEMASTAGQPLVEGFVLAAYRFWRYKTEDRPFRGPDHLKVIPGEAVAGKEDSAFRQGARRGLTVARATITARNLVNLSPNEKTASAFASMIEKAGRKHGYKTTVWDKKRIKKEGLGGLLAVNRGSVAPPSFTIMEWAPANPVNEQPIVLIGKSVVFDTGGLSLKPTKQSMDYMKADMAGGAAVVGAFEAVAQLDLPVQLIGLIPATDNRPGQDAYVPGEVVHMHDETTVEVLNTDAEGRLTLADALSYAQRYEPELVVDLATLTGASVVALGHEAAALMTQEDEAAENRLQAFEEAGRQSGDYVHALPMYEEYAELLESDIADLKNIGGKEAGAVTAAKFLEHFVDYPWLHLDIAGPAFLHKAKPYRPRGGTGFGVRLLTQFLRVYTGQ